MVRLSAPLTTSATFAAGAGGSPGFSDPQSMRLLKALQCRPAAGTPLTADPGRYKRLAGADAAAPISRSGEQPPEQARAVAQAADPALAAGARSVRPTRFDQR